MVALEVVVAAALEAEAVPVEGEETEAALTRHSKPTTVREAYLHRRHRMN
jgi:hypothetical protein